MNQAVVKKQAEVQAFMNLAAEIRRRGGEPLAVAAGEVVAALVQLGGEQAFELTGAAAEIFETKLARTTTKLTTMMELYVGDEWDNPVEVLEWLSFYAGAAAAHAALVSGALGDAPSGVGAERIGAEFSTLLAAVTAALKLAGGRLTQSAKSSATQ